MSSIIFILGVVFTLLFTANYFINKHFLLIKNNRVVDKNKIFIGEEVNVTMTIENRSNIGIPYLFIKEFLPKEIFAVGKSSIDFDATEKCYNSFLSINKKERVKRIYKITASKRGVYNLKRISITIGDLFGVLEKNQEVEYSNQLIVFPKYKNLREINFINNSLYGDKVVKRFIFDDPLMVKGIREYTVNHRMKDIHWNSSLKSGRLMVKEYDYTSDREVVIILNVQCGEPAFLTMDGERIENGISLTMSLADFCIEQAVSTSIWTNSSLADTEDAKEDKTLASAYNLEPILEMGARITNWTRRDFSKYLEENIMSFNFKNLYLIVTPFLDNRCEEILSELNYKGVDMKIIDISEDGLNKIANIDMVRVEQEAII